MGCALRIFVDFPNSEALSRDDYEQGIRSAQDAIGARMAKAENHPSRAFNSGFFQAVTRFEMT